MVLQSKDLGTFRKPLPGDLAPFFPQPLCPGPHGQFPFQKPLPRFLGGQGKMVEWPTAQIGTGPQGLGTPKF